MKQISTEKTMTVKEVAEILSVSDQAVRDSIRKLFPDILVHGKTTYLNEKQVTAIKLQIQSGGNRNSKDNFEVVSVTTNLEKELIIMKALQFQQEKIQELKEENERLIPKAIAHDTFLSAQNAQPMHEVSKLFGLGRNKLFEMLRNARILMDGNVPYQDYMKYFEVKAKTVIKGNYTENIPVTLVKPNGIDYIMHRFNLERTI